MGDRVTYDAVVCPDLEAGAGYMAVSTARYCGVVMITDWAWIGYGATPEEAIAGLEQRLHQVHGLACRPRRIIYTIAMEDGP